MTGITKALHVLSGAAVALLLSAGTDESAVRNIVNGIVQTASLAVAPILRDLPPAPQLRGNAKTRCGRFRGRECRCSSLG